MTAFPRNLNPLSANGPALGASVITQMMTTAIALGDSVVLLSHVAPAAAMAAAHLKHSKRTFGRHASSSSGRVSFSSLSVKPLLCKYPCK
jgi:hypothetical protein